MVPDWALLPIVVLATAATIIASQAVITGAYSLTRQAIQLGLLPRMEIRFTSEAHAGKIYMPQVNWLSVWRADPCRHVQVIGAASPPPMASPSPAPWWSPPSMAIFVIWKYWKWPLWAALAMMLPLLAIDVIFLGANALKVLEGGWVPLALGGMLMLIMWTWRRGSRILFAKTRTVGSAARRSRAKPAKAPAAQVPGTAVFFTSDPDSAPTALLHSLKHYKVLHENNVVLTIRTSDSPSAGRRRPGEDRKAERPLQPPHRHLRLHGNA